MSMQNNERNPHISVIPVGTVATSASATLPGIFFRKHARIKGVWLVNQGSTIAKSATNHVLAILQDNAGTPVKYASADSSDASVVQLTQFPLTLLSPDDADTNHLEKDVPAGTMLNVSVQTLGSSSLASAVLLVEHYSI